MTRLMMRRLLLLIVLTAYGAAAPLAQRDWNAPFPAHHVMDNVYFVGTQQLGTFLITTPEGHVLINSDLPTLVRPTMASRRSASGSAASDSAGNRAMTSATRSDTPML